MGYITINKKVGEFDFIDNRFYAVDCCCCCCCCVISGTIGGLAGYTVTEAITEHRGTPEPKAAILKWVFTFFGIILLGGASLFLIEAWYWMIIQKNILLSISSLVVSTAWVIVLSIIRSEKTGRPIKYSQVVLFILLSTIILNLLGYLLIYGFNL